MVRPEEWEWLGHPAHFICGDRCVYHLATRVGSWLVSTLGEYKADGWRSPITEVGSGRLYETMVFRAVPCTLPEECGEPHIESGESVDFAAANTRREARENHMRLCAKWAAVTEPTCAVENCDHVLGGPSDSDDTCSVCLDQMERQRREESET